MCSSDLGLAIKCISQADIVNMAIVTSIGCQLTVEKCMMSTPLRVYVISIRPSSACRSVISSANSMSPPIDFILIEAKNKKSIGIKDIREYVGDTINLLPYYGGYKIYIIKDAQNITVQAQNALLKTIEAPPR